MYFIDLLILTCRLICNSISGAQSSSKWTTNNKTCPWSYEVKYYMLYIIQKKKPNKKKKTILKSTFGFLAKNVFLLKHNLNHIHMKCTEFFLSSVKTEHKDFIGMVFKYIF